MNKKSLVRPIFRTFPVTGAILLFFSATFSLSALDTHLGDVNQNGKVEITDALMTAQYAVGSEPADFYPQYADVDADGNIRITDALMIAQYVVGLISAFPGAGAEYPLPDWNSWRESYATYTGSGYTGGAALLDPVPPEMEITALNPADYNLGGVNAALAGAYLEVYGEKGSTVVYVTDLYPEGADGALDLCPTSFAKIGEMAAGKIDIRWKITAAPVTGNCSYRIKEGSSGWWAAIQVRDHLYPVLSMEYLKNGSWIPMEKMPYNHFMARDMGTDDLVIRMTDIRGQMIEDTLPSLPDGAQPAFIIAGNVQFSE